MREDCSALLLAGGQSSRMGTPKAWLPFAGRPLLVHLVERLEALAAEVLVVGAPDQSLPETAARVVTDATPGEGPLAGLAAGLQAATRPLACVASCDLPFLNPRVVEYLLSLADDVDAVVPEWEGLRNPLHAVYRTTLGIRAVELLGQGVRRPIALCDPDRTRIVSEAEIRRLDPEGRSFLNMNTPEEYIRALELWEQYYGPYGGSGRIAPDQSKV